MCVSLLIRLVYRAGGLSPEASLRHDWHSLLTTSDPNSNLSYVVSFYSVNCPRSLYPPFFFILFILYQTRLLSRMSSIPYLVSCLVLFLFQRVGLSLSFCFRVAAFVSKISLFFSAPRFRSDRTLMSSTPRPSRWSTMSAILPPTTTSTFTTTPPCVSQVFLPQTPPDMHDPHLISARLDVRISHSLLSNCHRQ